MQIYIVAYIVKQKHNICNEIDKVNDMRFNNNNFPNKYMSYVTVFGVSKFHPFPMK